MASFKINIADPKSGKCYKTEIKDAQADPFMGLNIGMVGYYYFFIVLLFY